MKNPSNGDPNVVAVTADGHSSLKFELSNGATVIAIAAGGDSIAANAKNRDALVEAVTRTLSDVKLPAPD